MKKYTCVIVDDETIARELLMAHIAKIPNLEILATCSDAINAKFILEKQSPDLLFLDIQMPNLNGIELLGILKKRPATILTTAFSEYALKGYELDVLDYLLKPIEFERFFKAVSKAVDWLDRGQTIVQNMEITLAAEPPNDYVFVKSDYQSVKVLFAEICFIEALQKYVRIHTTTQRIVTLLPMSQLEAMLPPALFMRIHRSSIVNLDKIDRVDGSLVHIGKHQLPISKSQREPFLLWLRKKGMP